MLNPRRISSAILVLAAAFSAPCFGQLQPATFRTVTSNTGPNTPRDVYAVDVNNDGILDIVQDSLGTAFTVTLANGDGTFRASPAYSYQFPSQYQSDISMASGDFNGDGKVDLIFELAGSNQLALFLGNGNGTFQAPKYITVALPSSQHFGGGYVLAADFSGDGKLDLVTEANTNTAGNLYLMKGDGAGNFGSPLSIYTIGEGFIVAGDFDGDGRADVAFPDNYDCTEGGCGASTVHVLYNGGNSSFTDIASYTSAGQLYISAGDLNSDGRTDIFGTYQTSGGSEVVVMYGQTERTFHTYTMTAPTLGTFAMADFNGDTRMDLVGVGPNSSNSSDQLVFFLADSSEGMFTQQTYGLPLYSASYPVVGDFNNDTKPDVAFVGEHTPSNQMIVDALNTTASGNWGGCAYPTTGTGIRMCAPSSSTASPATFNASANSFGQLRKMELWVDGKKVVEQHHTWGPKAWFDFSDTLASGSHKGVMFAADIDNRLQKTVFNFTVGAATCSAPASPGVDVCQPASGSSVSSPVQVEAAATVTGTISHMELWVDGVKKYSAAGAALNTSVSLAAGSHRFAVLAINTAGQKWERAVDATVK